MTCAVTISLITNWSARQSVRGGLPFWEPTLFNGYPFMAQPQQNAFYPPLWPGFHPAHERRHQPLYARYISGWPAWACFCLCAFSNGRWLPAMLAAIAFAFSGLLAGRLWAGHSTVYALVAWTPWIVLGLLWSVRRESVWTAVYCRRAHGPGAAGRAYSLLSLRGPDLGAVCALPAAQRKRPPPGWFCARRLIMLVVGLALAAVQLAPFLQFSLASGRLAEADYNFATDYSLPPAHLVTLLVPEFFGEPTRVGYWSVPTFEELAYYAGLLAILGIVLALRKPSKNDLVPGYHDGAGPGPGARPLRGAVSAGLQIPAVLPHCARAGTGDDSLPFCGHISPGPRFSDLAAYAPARETPDKLRTYLALDNGHHRRPGRCWPWPRRARFLCPSIPPIPAAVCGTRSAAMPWPHSSCCLAAG